MWGEEKRKQVKLEIYRRLKDKTKAYDKMDMECVVYECNEKLHSSIGKDLCYE